MEVWKNLEKILEKGTKYFSKNCNNSADFTQVKFMEIWRNYVRKILGNVYRNDKILTGFHAKRKCFCASLQISDFDVAFYKFDESGPYGDARMSDWPHSGSELVINELVQLNESFYWMRWTSSKTWNQLVNKFVHSITA